jgi:hypothetical protein
MVTIFMAVMIVKKTDCIYIDGFKLPVSGIFNFLSLKATY